MKPNLLRQKLNAGHPTVGTRVHNIWPAIVEVIGHTQTYDYVEFLAEYAPYDLDALDNFCRAVELFEMSSIIKVDPEQRTFLAQRGIGAGFQGVLFADVRTAEDRVNACESAVPIRPRMAAALVLRCGASRIWITAARQNMLKRCATQW